MNYLKYQLDIVPFECTQTYPSTTHLASYEHLVVLVNDLHYGCQYDLKHMKAYRVKGCIRYVGQFYKTQQGKVKVKF